MKALLAGLSAIRWPFCTHCIIPEPADQHGISLDKRVGYPYADSSILGRKSWWLFGAFDWNTQELTVSFCDLGIGIAKSLPREYSAEIINDVLSAIPFVGKSNHPKMLKAAMEIGRTKTKKRYRGKGLPSMKQIVMANPNSSFRIYSGRGCYEYPHNGNEMLYELESPMPGTLLEWKFTLPSAQRNLFDAQEKAA